MPELPEVEVTRRKIAPLLVGRAIERVVTTKPSYFFVTPPKALVRALETRRVTELVRHGKYLIATLDDAQRVLLHLGMTGQLFADGVSSPRLVRKVSTVQSVSEANLEDGWGSASFAGGAGRARALPDKKTAQLASFTPDLHTHLQIHFADGGPAVYFRDARKFGKVELLAGATNKRLDKLGIDALQATGADLYRATRKRRIAIKTVLLDQSVMAGVGNIYADEGLFLARVKPTHRADKVSAASCDALVAALQRVMLRSIETGGSSISDYVQPDGQDGGYQDERRVYARKGEPCSVCGTRIRRIVLGQRSSFFCPTCQK